MPDATDPTPEPAATDARGPADAADAPAAADPAEEQKRKFREALERKQGAKHPHDEVLAGRSLHGRGGDTNRHEFRRKSGGGGS